MNKLLEELAKEAGFECKKPNDIIEWRDKNYDEELERFAWLIIHECKLAISPHLRDMISRGKACDLITKHFENDSDEEETVEYHQDVLGNLILDENGEPIPDWRCICNAWAGIECVCGAWDKPLPKSLLKRSDQV